MAEETGEKKRIIIRVDDSTWALYDDKRHNSRLSFQQLGEHLFAKWFAGDIEADSPEIYAIPKYQNESLRPKVDEAKGRRIAYDQLEVSEAERSWVEKFLRVLRSKIFGRAIKENVESFCLGLDAAELVETYGERESDPASGKESFDKGVARVRKAIARFRRTGEADPPASQAVRKKEP